MEATLDVLETGLVYRESGFDPYLRNAYWPTVVELASGEFVVAMNISSDIASSDMRPYCTRSTDGGKTWTRPQKIFEPDESAHPVQATIRISRTPDGQLIGIAGLLDRSRVGAPRTNPKTGGTVEMEHAIVRSDDGGKTWSEPQKFDSPLKWKCYGEPSPILPLSTNRWLLPSLTRLNWCGECPFGLKAFVMISEDRGETWPRAVDVFDFWRDRRVAWEQKQTRLTDGRLFAITWVFNTVTKENEPNRYTFSKDEGESYGPALESPLHGQTCTPLALADNHILCVYRRLDKRGLWAHLARIDGNDWHPVIESSLWGTDVEALPGATDSSIENQAALRFGFPTVIRLAAGDVFVVFWGIEDGLSVIRWYRLATSC